MSLYLPQMDGIEPWDVVIKTLELLKNPEKIFQYTQKNGRGLAGFIICAWDHDNALKWWDTGDVYDSWDSVADTGSTEEPRIYQTYRGIRNRLEKLNSQMNLPSRERILYTRKIIAHVGLAYWIHPESHYQPLDQYVRLSEGARFPGSPTQ